MFPPRNSWPACLLLAYATLAVLFVPWFAWERPDLWSLSYNLPIALAFLLLGWELVLSVRARGWRAEAVYLAVWFVGLVVLSLRLGVFTRGEAAIPVSGHMVWCPLMAAHAISRNAPRWVVAIVLAVFVQATVLKAMTQAWFNGAAGLAVGTLLAVPLLAYRAPTAG